LIPGLRKESKANSHSINQHNEKLTSSKKYFINENVISSKKIDKKGPSNYFTNTSTKNPRFISSTNGSGILTFKGGVDDDNSKNMFAISPSNSLDNTDFRVKSDYTLIQEEDYNMSKLSTKKRSYICICLKNININ